MYLEKPKRFIIWNEVLRKALRYHVNDLLAKFIMFLCFSNVTVLGRLGQRVEL
jgi:hypothetical protein